MPYLWNVSSAGQSISTAFSKLLEFIASNALSYWSSHHLSNSRCSVKVTSSLHLGHLSASFDTGSVKKKEQFLFAHLEQQTKKK